MDHGQPDVRMNIAAAPTPPGAICLNHKLHAAFLKPPRLRLSLKGDNYG
jgi:hypothetical protein